MRINEQYNYTAPVVGKTYSLYGNHFDTKDYYNTISNLTTKFIEDFGSAEKLLNEITVISNKKRYLKKLLKKDFNNNLHSKLLKTLNNELSHYTKGVKSHLEEMPILKLRDSVLYTSGEQYHLYMIEIELVNRIYAEQFNQCKYKIALLPHCLRDLSRACLSKPDELDYICKGCSKICNINHVSKILRSHNIKAYIWIDATRKKIFKDLKLKHKSFGIFGIACIPELVNGMRMCIKNNIPVSGIPLDANRCSRWMGESHDNTINLEKVEQLLS